jgi:hypothetical protein
MQVVTGPRIHTPVPVMYSLIYNRFLLHYFTSFRTVDSTWYLVAPPSNVVCPCIYTLASTMHTIYHVLEY